MVLKLGVFDELQYFVELYLSLLRYLVDELRRVLRVSLVFAEQAHDDSLERLLLTLHEFVEAQAFDRCEVH